jgi:hypothetical protein
MNAHLDFIRLGSWDYASYPYTLSKIMEAWPGDWEASKWLQYKGWRKPGFFIGHGMQNDERHHVLAVSGSMAQRMKNGLIGSDGWYGTRIDVQITIPRPSNVSLPKVQLKLGKRGTTLISSEENDTLYLGSRKSELFTRLYEKPLDKMYLRLEFELKSTRARSAWDAIREGESVGSVFAYYLDKSSLPDKVKIHFEEADDTATSHAMQAEIAADNAKTLKWIESLDTCMMRHMHNHEIGDRVMEIIRAWAMHSTEVDNLAHTFVYL